jgi:hypothetical protein
MEDINKCEKFSDREREKENIFLEEEWNGFRLKGDFTLSISCTISLLEEFWHFGAQTVRYSYIFMPRAR